MKNKYTKIYNRNLMYANKRKIQCRKAGPRSNRDYFLEKVLLYTRSATAPSDENSSSSLTVTS